MYCNIGKVPGQPANSVMLQQALIELQGKTFNQKSCTASAEPDRCTQVICRKSFYPDEKNTTYPPFDNAAIFLCNHNSGLMVYAANLNLPHLLITQLQKKRLNHVLMIHELMNSKTDKKNSSEILLGYIQLRHDNSSSFLLPVYRILPRALGSGSEEQGKKSGS
jgi:hypothetical protein